MNNLPYYIAIFFIVATALPYIKHDGWWIRIFEFPRIQLACIGLVSLYFLLYISPSTNLSSPLIILVIICVALQIAKIIPFTRIFPVQMVGSKNSNASDTFKVIIANVYMDNDKYQQLASIIDIHNPDVLLAIEVNRHWCEYLSTHTNFTHEVLKPLDNTYGIALYSQLELIEPEIKFIIENDIPSIHTKVKLSSGEIISLHCLHPKPPAPQESTYTTKRDAELLLVGKEIKKENNPAIVMGDLNDVAWSYTTTLFQKISGLLDPRIGRGMFNSYNAKFPLLRFPLDHAFASKHFKLINLARLPKFGSDHFPILLEFVIKNDAIEKNVKPKLEKEEKKIIDEKISSGISE